MRKQSKTQNSDQLTLMVFQGNLASKSFTIPLRWISQAGWMIGLAIFAVIVSTFFALKYYRVALQSTPEHTLELEKKLSEIKTINETLQAKLSHKESLMSSPPSTDVKETVTLSPSGTRKEDFLFHGLPETVKLENASLSKIKLTQPTFKWKNGKVQVKFFIKYTAKDGGSQAGRIILIARGNEQLFVYPSSAMNPPSSQTLLSPLEGESFSLRRVREVKALFGPIQQRNDIRHLDILIFDSKGNLLIKDAKPVRVVSAKPVPQSLIEEEKKNEIEASKEADPGANP
ncbi:MAG: hypothetical protein CL678_18055 [Bdellovibrionaceae bacterium]|nr:hypothetical protein [Pseudobdellovibrionaceae bacterium]|tara:strand:+ start:538 stop:1398 length:861 start_codon:yes stop_codon:yes gene_type:complete